MAEGVWIVVVLLFETLGNGCLFVLEPPLPSELLVEILGLSVCLHVEAAPSPNNNVTP